MEKTCSKCGHTLKGFALKKMTTVLVLLGILFTLILLDIAMLVILLYLIFLVIPGVFAVFKKRKVTYFCSHCSSTFSEEDFIHK